MSRKYDSGSSLQQKILAGINVLADNVASTMGPRGRNVILHQKGFKPVITKDGVTVAKFVELEDPIENAGVEILKQASEQTNDNAGDGTTTATVLARAIYRDALQYLTTGASPVEIKRGIDLAVKAVVEDIEDQAKPVMSLEDIEHIATISANGDKTIGNLIATAIDQAGKDGAITIEEARSFETSLDIVEGFRFDSGYVSNQFVTDERRSAVKYEDPLILVTDAKVGTVDEMLPALELVAREGKALVVVAEDIEGQALAALIMNAVRGTMKVAAVKAPRYGEERRGILRDLAVSVGATFLSREKGATLRDIKLEDFGTAQSVDITRNLTTIIGGDGDEDDIEEAIETLKEEVASAETLEYAERIQERITRLASGVAILRVGAATEIEMIEKKHRIEDALEAVRSAQQEGIVAGGGVALVRAIAKLDEIEEESDEHHFAIEIVRNALMEPIRQMSINAGHSPDLVVAQVESADENMGWNFADGEMVNMFEAGILDPAKVTRTALQNAASVASTLLTSNYAIVE